MLIERVREQAMPLFDKRSQALALPAVMIALIGFVESVSVAQSLAIMWRWQDETAFQKK